MRVYVIINKLTKEPVQMFLQYFEARRSPLVRHYPESFSVRPAELTIYEQLDEYVDRTLKGDH